MKKKPIGRKNKYFTHVLPRFDEIADWCNIGASDKEIYENLQISRSCFYDYLNTYREFSDLIKTSRKNPVKQIKAALLRRACGYDYTEKRVIESEKDGKRTETNTKHLPPDPASAMILLKHWAKEEGWTNDPAILAIRKKELALKEKEIEKNNW